MSIMEAQVKELVEVAFDLLAKAPPNKRVIIGLCGIPGSGKTTLARKVVAGINARHHTTHPTDPPADIAQMVPMDGYHLPLSALHAMPDPSEALRRRGAPFTFTPEPLLGLLTTLSHPIPPTSTIYAPSFSHTNLDPVPSTIPIHPHHRLLLFEGLYLSLNHPTHPTWRAIADTFTERWFLECDIDVARERLVARHVLAGICKDAEEARGRVEGSDLLNARLVMGEGRVGGERVVRAVEEVGWGVEDGVVV